MSTVTFRNVDVSPADAVSEWPLEAIQASLERGGLADWRRLASAIRAEPWGRVARQVEEVLTYSRPYGVSAAFERAISRAREAALSTYVSGKVTPSAALMLRMRHVVGR